MMVLFVIFHSCDNLLLPLLCSLSDLLYEQFNVYAIMFIYPCMHMLSVDISFTYYYIQCSPSNIIMYLGLRSYNMSSGIHLY